MKPKRFIFVVLICFLACFRANGQPERDTVYYEIKMDMIDQAEVHKHEKVASYYVHIRLKEKYHSEFNELTGNNIGNILAVAQEGKVLHPSLPVILTNIHGGRMTLDGFEKKERAEEVIRQIFNKEE